MINLKKGASSYVKSACPKICQGKVNCTKDGILYKNIRVGCIATSDENCPTAIDCVIDQKVANEEADSIDSNQYLDPKYLKSNSRGSSR